MWVVLSGLAVGAAFGYAAQRGRFCLASAFFDLVSGGERQRWRAYLLATGVASVLAFALRAGGLINPGLAGFAWAGALAGGLLFGIGMTYAAGCACGTFYRLGDGNGAALVTAAGFLLGTGLTLGPLAGLVGALRGPQLAALTLPDLLRVNPWAVAGVLWLALAAYLWLAPAGRPDPQAWDWRRTGLVLGVVAAAAWPLSAAVGPGQSVTAVVGTAEIWGWLASGLRAFGGLGWATCFLVGLPLGAFAAARRHGEFHLRPPRRERILPALLGGVLMGLGAQAAAGCTLGNSLAAVALLSTNGLLATAAFIGGAWLAARLSGPRLLRLSGRRAA